MALEVSRLDVCRRVVPVGLQRGDQGVDKGHSDAVTVQDAPGRPLCQLVNLLDGAGPFIVGAQHRQGLLEVGLDVAEHHQGLFQLQAVAPCCCRGQGSLRYGLVVPRCWWHPVRGDRWGPLGPGPDAAVWGEMLPLSCLLLHICLHLLLMLVVCLCLCL